MKKVYLLAAAAVFVLGSVVMTSCKKNAQINDTVQLCKCGYYSKLTGKDSVIKTTEFNMYFSEAQAKKNCQLRADTLQRLYPYIICDINF